MSASASSTSEPHAPASFQGEVQGWRACPYAQPGCPTPVKCHQLHPQGSSTHSLTYPRREPPTTHARDTPTRTSQLAVAARDVVQCGGALAVGDLRGLVRELLLARARQRQRVLEHRQSRRVSLRLRVSTHTPHVSTHVREQWRCLAAAGGAPRMGQPGWAWSQLRLDSGTDVARAHKSSVRSIPKETT